MAKLELKNLNKTYTAQVVPVQDLSLTVADGEFLTLLGPSGCGKSTTLRLIAGLEQPSRGDVLIGDRLVTHQRAGDRDIAMVFQSYALYPHMTVYENIASGLKLRKLAAAEIAQRVAKASQTLNLEELMGRKPGQLSGGQRQRVALGRALVRNPAVFLLDEPLSNLDALLREQVRAELKQLFDRQPASVVYVTHDQTEAMTLSTKVAVLYQGQLQQLDPPERIYAYPANQFVAGFIGSPQMNLLTLRCEQQTALFAHLRLPLPGEMGDPRQVVLGIRPEHLCLLPEKDVNGVQGSVDLVENLGMSRLLRVKIKDYDLTVRLLLPMDQPWSGEEVTLGLLRDHLHWFDIQTQARRG